MSQNVFVYGTLMYPEVLRALIKRVPEHQKAIIHGFQRYGIRGQVFPAIIHSSSQAAVQGILLYRLTPDEMDVFDEFEGDEYYKVSVEAMPLVEDNAAPSNASVYVWQDSLRSLLLESPWDPEAFREKHLQPYVGMCEQFSEELRAQKGRPTSRPLGFG